MKTVTLKFLEKHEACQEAVEWYKTQKKKDYKSLLTALINDNKNFSWGLWYLTRKLSKENNIRLAIYIASQVLDIFKVAYPDDKRPHKAIQAARRYLKASNKKNAAAHVAAAAAHATSVAVNKRNLQIKILKHGLKLLGKTK